MSRLLLALLVTAVGTAAFAQAPNPFGDAVRTSTSHLTVESSISRLSAAPGDRLTVTLDVTPRRTMHVYAPGKHDYQVVGLSIEAQPWLRAEPTKYPPSEMYHFEPLNETVEVYSKTFRLAREVTILETAEAKKALAGQSSVTIAGQLEYQACDDKVCYSPTKVPVRFTVTLKQ
ncbi:MAG: protein-disulfide reductase DsbD domain-containing protein [Vicinamibacterales bacterium]